jgi:pimeloyl-ACP methyl ester carboxylesterase
MSPGGADGLDGLSEHTKTSTKGRQMAGYVQLGDVTTWYDEHGEGELLVLLHPGGADARAFAPNIGALAARFHVFTPERRGHGHTPDVDGPITYQLMATDTIAFLERVVGGPAHLVANSDGMPVALLVALRRPDLARHLVLVSGVFHRDGWVPQTADVDEGAAAFLAAGYAQVSPDGHQPVRGPDRLNSRCRLRPRAGRPGARRVSTAGAGRESVPDPPHGGPCGQAFRGFQVLQVPRPRTPRAASCYASAGVWA